MRDLERRKRTAIEAVARRFSATWEQRSVSSDASIVVAGNLVAVDIATLKQGRTGESKSVTKPRLRFDRVATGLIARLQDNLDETAPDGMTTLLTVTAPILLPSKTGAALADKIGRLLAQRSLGRFHKETVCGNAVRIRLLRNAWRQAPKLIGFIHNPESDPVPLLNVTRDLLGLIAVRAAEKATQSAADRWLVVISAERGLAYLETYRYICSQLGMPAGLRKILMVFGDDHVELLTG